MKRILLVILGLVFSMIGSASEVPLLSKIVTNGTVSPKELRSKKVEIYEFGDVLITLCYGYKIKSERGESISLKTLQSITSCLKSNPIPMPLTWPKCAGGESVSYYAGNSLIFLRSCGEEAKSAHPCVENAIKILDQYGSSW